MANCCNSCCIFTSFRLYKNPSVKTTIYAVLARLFLFYAGHIQYFIYSVIFEFITVIAHVIYDSLPGEKKANSFRYIKKYVESYIYMFVFSLPLLLPMWHQTTISAQRSGKLPFEIFFGQYYPIDQLMKGLFYPFLQVNENTYASFTNMLNLSHIGYLTLLFIVIGIAEKYIKKSKNIIIGSARLSVFVRPVLIALLWSTNWVFNLAVYCIPILNRFRWPFKLAFYFDFYLIVVSSLLLSHFIKELSWKKVSKNLAFCLLIGIQIYNFIFLYTATPYKDFGEHHADKLPSEEKLKDKLTGGRIISLGFDVWADTPQNNQDYLTAPTLGFNYATLWGLDYFAGYEPLISSANSEACLGMNFTSIIEPADPIPINYFRKAAVKWYIVPKNKAYEYSKKLNVRVTTITIDISVDDQQEDVIIFNNLYNPFFEGYIDGEKTKLTPTNNIHFSISVPKGKHHITIRYMDPYLITGIYLCVGFLIIIVLKRYYKKLYKAVMIKINKNNT